MKLSEAVAAYIGWKQLNGYRFERSSRTLQAFLRTFPELTMEDVNADHLLGFLNNRPTSTITWRLKYWTLVRFLEHWSNRDVVTLIVMPLAKPFAPQTFVPYIFTDTEVAALLATISQSHNSRRRIDDVTLKTMILLLYGTGMTVGEVTLIRHADVELETGFLNVQSTRPSRSRRIPIGGDLRVILGRFLEGRSVSDQTDALFLTRTGLTISSFRLARHFRRLRKLAGIRRRDGAKQQPRVDDLRYSFAVRRIAQWIEEAADLNRMLPALAAYMGQVGLGSTERYLLLTPERFRQHLDKLSPSIGRGMWSEDADLMTFLSML